MNVEELKTYVRTMLNSAFPTVTVHFERISDDPFHIGVAVYGVESNAVKWVKDKILDIDEKLCANTDFVITPLVRDEAATAKYYPHLMSAWQACDAPKKVAFFHHVLTDVEVEVLENVWLESSVKWEFASPPSPVCANAANQELALSA